MPWECMFFLFFSYFMISNHSRMVAIQVCLKEFILLSVWLVIARGGKKTNNSCNLRHEQNFDWMLDFVSKLWSDLVM